MSGLRARAAAVGRWLLSHRTALPVLLTVCGVAIAARALARPGGGGSFGGGGGGGSSGGGGDDDFIFDLLFLVLEVCVDYPKVGIPALLFVVVFVVIRLRLANTRSENSSSLYASSAPEDSPEQATAISESLESIRATDEDFSLVLFEDFLYGLYAEVRYRQGRGEVAQLSAFLAPGVITELASDRPEVNTVVIGAMRYVSVDVAGSDEVRVSVEFETNYGTDQSAVYSRDLWQLKRRRGARSRPPGRARVFNCPSCGAPMSAVVEGRCSHCEKDVATGRFDWVVDSQMNEGTESRGPMLTGTAKDQGVDHATRVHPAASQRLAALRTRDPQFDWGSFRQRLTLIFREFQSAWAARDLAAMRPFLSDMLFEEERYWVEAYRKQGLRNITENARITRTELARVTTDKYFDAITVRLFAAGHDYVVDEGGKLVSGSRGAEMPYSEYWTLIRSTQVSGTPGNEKKCPNCGAPLKVNMAGVCEYCSTKVTSGDFDWVLSRIEQASAYAG